MSCAARKKARAAAAFFPSWLGQFADGELPRGVVRIELRHAFQAIQRRLFPPARQKQLGCQRELFDGLVGAVLLLQQEGVPRHALGRLLYALQRARIDGSGLVLFAEFAQSVEQHDRSTSPRDPAWPCRV